MRITATTESKWCIFGKTELSFEEKYKQAKRKINNMSKKEKQELAKKCFGMWANRGK